jgi:hypothetical protein
MTLCRSRGGATNARVPNVQAVQSVQALTSVLPRDAGEDAGGGLNDLNFLNELNPGKTGSFPSLCRTHLSIAVSAITLASNSPASGQALNLEF